MSSCFIPSRETSDAIHGLAFVAFCPLVERGCDGRNGFERRARLAVMVYKLQHGNGSGSGECKY